MLAGQAPGHQMLPVAVLLHRLPVGLTIWFLLRPVYGLGAALDVLGVVGVATAVGFFTSEAVAGFMENPGWGVFEDWS